MPGKRTRKSEETIAKDAAASGSATKKRKIEPAASAKKAATAAKRAPSTKKAPAAKKAAPKKAPAKKAPPKKAPAKDKKAAEPKKAPAKAKKPAAAKPKKPAVAELKKPVVAELKKPAEPQLPKLPEPAPFLKARTAPVHELAKRPTAVGSVFVFGNGDCGQLGLGDDMIERKKPFPVAAIQGEKIVDIVSGGLHTVVLTESGKLWSWGCNDQKALGRSGDEYTAAPVEGLDGVKITKVTCSDSATFALSDDGHVYSWGTFRSAEGIMGFTEDIEIQDKPMVINAFREPVVDLCAGVDHALALSASGKVYAWGYGQQGQLGRLIMERRRTRGLVPEKLRLQDIYHIGSGSYHSFAVAKDGTVYAWGLNNFHQLGLRPEDGGSEEIVHEPTVVSALKDLGVVKISGGEHHSVALTKDGKLYTFGRSDSHQTGLPFDTLEKDKKADSAEANSNEASHKKAITAPTFVEDIPKLADIVCGSNHNIALADNGKAYTWGYGEMLQLGNGEEEDIERPTLLEGQKIEGKTIVKVAAGGQHSVVLAN